MCYSNIASMKQQLESLGLALDWDRVCVYVMSLYCFSQQINFFFFFSSGFSHHLGSLKWLLISFFNFVLSSTSSSFNPRVSISLLHKSFYLVFCLPLCLFPGTGASNILHSTCPSSLLLTCPCPYHFSLFSVIFFVAGATFTDPLTCSFLILSFLLHLNLFPRGRFFLTRRLQQPSLASLCLIISSLPSCVSYCSSYSVSVFLSFSSQHMHHHHFYPHNLLSCDVCTALTYFRALYWMFLKLLLYFYFFRSLFCLGL